MDRIWAPKLGVPNIKDPDTSIIQGEATPILGQLRTDGYVHVRLKYVTLKCIQKCSEFINFHSFDMQSIAESVLLSRLQALSVR